MMGIRKWLPSTEELLKIPASVGAEQLVGLALTAAGSWATTHWVSPDTRFGWLLVFFGTSFALIFAYGAIGWARAQWGSVPADSVELPSREPAPSGLSLIAVRGKVFRNCEVPIDGHSYTECEFRSVTLLYDGGPVEMTRNTFVGGFVMRSSRREINAFVKMMNSFGFLKISAIDERGIVAPSNPAPI